MSDVRFLGDGDVCVRQAEGLLEVVACGKGERRKVVEEDELLNISELCLQSLRGRHARQRLAPHRVFHFTSRSHTRMLNYSRGHHDEGQQLGHVIPGGALHTV